MRELLFGNNTISVIDYNSNWHLTIIYLLSYYNSKLKASIVPTYLYLFHKLPVTRLIITITVQ